MFYGNFIFAFVPCMKSQMKVFVCQMCLMLSVQLFVVIHTEKLECSVEPAINRGRLFLGKSVLGLPFLYQNTGLQSEVISMAIPLLYTSNKLIYTSTPFVFITMR